MGICRCKQRCKGCQGGDEDSGNKLLYGIDDVPPWYTTILLGFQHYLTMFGSTFSVPLVLARHFCLADDHLGLSELVGTIFFISGVCTLLQTVLGSRLPIVQGASFAFIIPTIAVLNLPQWKCPYNDASSLDSSNLTLPETGSPEHREMWQSRLREIQGAIMVSSLVQVVVGFSGMMGLLLRYIGPLAVTPTVTLIGLSLFGAAADKASKQWWIAIMTVMLMAIFSQYLRNVTLPLMYYSRRNRKWKWTFVPIFKLFPIILAVGVSWAVCGILTSTNALSSIPGQWGYEARTDTRTYVLHSADWFRFPYPGQWGVPTVSGAAVCGMIAGVVASMLESVGDYYACARLSAAPPPPAHAVNRGIGVEGIGCILAGAWGSGNGTTSYSENVGAIGITKVGSRRVIQTGAAIMLILGCLGKFGALFITIPDPVVGGMFFVMFGMITAVGLSNLQFVDLNSSRNLFVLGTSIFGGLALPNWMYAHSNSINTGNQIVDQILAVLCSTSMFVGGTIGFILDNTIPGTMEERGITRWRQLEGSEGDTSVSVHTYDIPIIQRFLERWTWTSYIPFSPTFGKSTRRDTGTGQHDFEVINATDKEEVHSLELNGGQDGGIGV